MMTKSTSRIWYIVLFALGLFVAAGSATLHYLFKNDVTVTVHQVETQLRSGISTGDSRVKVEAFLDQQGIPHSFIEHSRWPGETRTEFALIRDTSRSTLIRDDIWIRFKFDEKDRLESYTVEEVLTGP